MLEGLEVSVLEKSQYLKYNTDFRIDPEYFGKEYLRLLEIILRKKTISVSDFAYVTDGIHTSIDYCEDSNINLISATSPRNNYFDISRGVYISKASHNENPRTALKNNDVIISTVGTIGNCAVVTKEILPANSDRHVGIIRIKDNSILPNYLSTYLLTKYGRFQTLRESTGNVQLNLFISKIKTLQIVKPSETFQYAISSLVSLANLYRVNSKNIYTQSEQLLLEELGLKDWQPSEEKTNIKSFKESFLSTGRLDAEYYQLKYEEIEEKIKGYRLGYDTLDTFIKNYSTGYPYSSETYIEREGIPLIRINNINKGNLDLSNPVYIPQKDLYLSPNDIAKENDILISMSGTIGNSCKIPKGIIAVINQRIMRITPQNYNDDTLPIVINSIIGLYQLSRIGTGGVQTNISSNDIRKILIPKLCEDIQEKISNKIQESFKLKQESEHLLEVAKRAVEIAIEQNEDAAIEYINQNQIKN